MEGLSLETVTLECETSSCERSINSIIPAITDVPYNSP